MRILSLTLLCFFLALSITARAQLSIGIKGGPDFSRILNAVKGNDGSGNIALLNSGTITQFYGGVFLDIPLDSGRGTMFYLRPGIDYVGAGGNMNPQGNYYNPNGFTPSTKYTLHYVDIPIDFVFSPNFDWGRPWIGLGFYGGILVNGTIKGPGNSSQAAIIGNNANDNFERFDLGYTFTMGLATKPGFLFGFDYQHGLFRIVPPSTGNNLPRLQTRNSVWGFHVGWIFKL